MARPIIVKVIKRVGLKDKKALKKALYDAYPFGQRKYHPYKIWLDEIKRHTGKKGPLCQPGKPVDDRQLKLF